MLSDSARNVEASSDFATCEMPIPCLKINRRPMSSIEPKRHRQPNVLRCPGDRARQRLRPPLPHGLERRRVEFRIARSFENLDGNHATIRAHGGQNLDTTGDSTPPKVGRIARFDTSAEFNRVL